ncbi:MAG: hypothetical protein CL678_01365 [Bdellovibrionaceae bacterium]|nr:hypothetical protein [Pseudobdellovibrionaceae bacterium]|tara:strand:- start:574 stop:795 length:222 start_codon:yes stop_codon:yes gene_type:complete
MVKGRILMGSSNSKEKTAVAKLSERFYKIKEGIKPSPELEKAIRDKQPESEKVPSTEKTRRIASSKQSRDIEI